MVWFQDANTKNIFFRSSFNDFDKIQFKFSQNPQQTFWLISLPQPL